jgi:hypothetical protein
LRGNHEQMLLEWLGTPKDAELPDRLQLAVKRGPSDPAILRSREEPGRGAGGRGAHGSPIPHPAFPRGIL